MVSLGLVFGMVMMMGAIVESIGWMDSLLPSIPHTKKECRRDRHCRQTQFCNRSEKECHQCRVTGQQCSRNKMCCRGFECAGRVCREKNAGLLRQRNEQCQRDRDCAYRHCCVKQNGKAGECKKMLLEGEFCGLNSVVFSRGGARCACAYGLKCRSTFDSSIDKSKPRKSRKKRFEKIRKDWEGGIKICVAIT